jgi:hypothetical protein
MGRPLGPTLPARPRGEAGGSIFMHYESVCEETETLNAGKGGLEASAVSSVDLLRSGKKRESDWFAAVDLLLRRSRSVKPVHA